MICIAGKNDIAAEVLEFVVDLYGAAGVIAVANADDPGRAGWQRSLRETAGVLGVRVVSLDGAYAQPGLHFFSVEFDRLVRPGRFVQAELYNIHFSLLPAYKGVYTSAWPILNGEARSGVTLHRIEAGIDTGPIIAQEPIAIGPEDTARDLYHACLKRGGELLRRWIPQLVGQPQPGQPQAAHGSTYYGRASLDYANPSFDLRQTAFQIHNAVRAFTFQEYQLPSVLGRRVCASRPTGQASRGKPGQLVQEDELALIISTIDYDLRLKKDYSLELFSVTGAGDAARAAQIVARVPGLEVRTRQGWTPLMMAAHRGDPELCGLLLDAGADVNAVNKRGTSVLMYAKSAAARSGDLQLLRTLLTRGADPAAQDFTGRTALDYARLEGHRGVIRLLEG